MKYVKNSGMEISGLNHLCLIIMQEVTICGDFIRYTLNYNMKYGRIRSFIIVKGILKARIQKLLTFGEIPLCLRDKAT